MNLSTIRKHLKKDAAAGRLATAMEAAGVPYGTARKLMRGDTGDPKLSTVERLRTYYGRHAAGVRGRRAAA